MIEIETLTVLISATANWDVRKPQEMEQQPRMLLPSVSVISHFNKLRSQVFKLCLAQADSAVMPKRAVFRDTDVHGEGAGCPQVLSVYILRLESQSLPTMVV